MTAALILLCAGLSRRFGEEDKLLYRWQGKPLYRYALDGLAPLRDGETRLVVVANAPEIQAECRRRGIPWTDSPRAAEGVSHSIRAGLALAGEAEGYLFCVADQPRLRGETLSGFLRWCREERAALACLSCGRVRGNPVWFDGRFRGALEALEGDTGGRRILAFYPELVQLYPVSWEELEDIDRPPCQPSGISV